MAGASVTNRPAPLSLRIAAVAALLCIFVTPGCAGVKPPSSVQASSAAQQASGEPAVPVASPAPSPSTPPTTVATRSGAAPIEPAKPSASPTPTIIATAAKADASAAKAPAKAAALKAPAAQPQKKESVALETAKKSAPTLDLTSLEQRLKETKAIGVLTKLALKNQVDDLLDQFRAFYQGKLKTTLAELRHPYDLLVLKVLSLLQDSDPSLASEIATSREAIWGILADPKKFATVA